MAKPTGEEEKGVWGREEGILHSRQKPLPAFWTWEASTIPFPLSQSYCPIVPPLFPLPFCSSPPRRRRRRRCRPQPPPDVYTQDRGQGGKSRKTDSFTTLLFLPAVQRGDEDEGQDEEQGGGGDHHDEGHLGLRHVLEGDGAPGGLGDGLVGQRVRQVVHLRREIAHHCETIGKSSHVRTFVGIIQGIEYVTPNAQMSPMTQKARTDLEWVLSESGWQMATYLTKAMGKRMKSED